MESNAACFPVLLFIEPSKVRGPWFRPQFPGCLWKCHLRRCKKPYWILAYPHVLLPSHRKNKQRNRLVWYDLVVTNHIDSYLSLCSLAHDLNTCPMIFLGNESQINWDSVSSFSPPFFFIIGTLSALFYPSIIQILKDNYHGLQDCSASSLSNLGWITGLNDLRKSNLSKQFLNISFAILAWVLTLLWLVLTVSAIWLQSGFLMKTEAIKGIKHFGLLGMFCY